MWKAARLAERLPPEARTRRGDSINAVWMSFSEQLLAVAVNQLRVLSWQNTKDGHKGRNAPTPILLPEQAVKELETQQKNSEKAHALAERIRQRKLAREESR